jgi:Ca2+-binding RTX toxin-like protein
VTLDNSLAGNDGGASDGFADADRGIENLVTGEGDDKLTGSIQGNDLTGNGGSDEFFAGDGNDIVRARDGEADEIDCGAFLFDEVDFDLKLDTVVNCEFLLGQSPLSRP